MALTIVIHNVRCMIVPKPVFFLYGYGLVNAHNVKMKKRYSKMWSCEQFLVAIAVKTGISQHQGT